MNNKDKNIVILYGGWSDERLISLESGKAVYNSLKNNNFNVHAFDLYTDDLVLLKEFIINNNIEVVFNLIHGAGGEDGYIQKYLENLSVVSIGSNSQASFKSFNKILTKESWLENNLKTPKYFNINPMIFHSNMLDQLGERFILKPIQSGSSVGINILNKKDFISDDKDLLYKKLCSFMNDDIEPNKYFIEEYIRCSEYTAPIIANTVYPIIKIDTDREFYNYDAKYLDEDTIFTFPKFTKKVQEHINRTCLKAFNALGCEVWGRVDFFMDDDHNINLIEINSIPGMTSHSLVPMSAKKAGLSYNELIILILGN